IHTTYRIIIETVDAGERHAGAEATSRIDHNGGARACCGSETFRSGPDVVCLEPLPVNKTNKNTKKSAFNTWPVASLLTHIPTSEVHALCGAEMHVPFVADTRVVNHPE